MDGTASLQDTMHLGPLEACHLESCTVPSEVQSLEVLAQWFVDGGWTMHSMCTHMHTCSVRDQSPITYASCSTCCMTVDGV